jgi:hypothetical protein
MNKIHRSKKSRKPRSKKSRKPRSKKSRKPRSKKSRKHRSKKSRKHRSKKSRKNKDYFPSFSFKIPSFLKKNKNEETPKPTLEEYKKQIDEIFLNNKMKKDDRTKELNKIVDNSEISLIIKNKLIEYIKEKEYKKQIDEIFLNNEMTEDVLNKNKQLNKIVNNSEISLIIKNKLIEYIKEKEKEKKINPFDSRSVNAFKNETFENDAFENENRPGRG